MSPTIRTYRHNPTKVADPAGTLVDTEVVASLPDSVSVDTSGWGAGSYEISVTQQAAGESESAKSNAVALTVEAAPTTTTTTTTTPAPPPGLFTDNFTAANGSAPNGTYWAAPINIGSFDGASTFNIQSNALQFYAKPTSGRAETYLFAKEAVPFANGRSVECKQLATSATNGDALESFQMGVAGADHAPNGNGAPTKNTVRLISSWNSADGHNVGLYSVDSAGVQSAALGFFSALATTPDLYELVFPNATQVELWLDGVLKGTYTHTATLGSTLLPYLRFVSDQTSQFTTWQVDDVVVA